MESLVLNRFRILQKSLLMLILYPKMSSRKPTTALGTLPAGLTSTADAYEQLLSSIREFASFGKLFNVFGNACYIHFDELLIRNVYLWIFISCNRHQCLWSLLKKKLNMQLMLWRAFLNIMWCSSTTAQIQFQNNCWKMEWPYFKNDLLNSYLSARIFLLNYCLPVARWPLLSMLLRLKNLLKLHPNLFDLFHMTVQDKHMLHLKNLELFQWLENSQTCWDLLLKRYLCLTSFEWWGMHIYSFFFLFVLPIR